VAPPPVAGGVASRPWPRSAAVTVVAAAASIGRRWPAVAGDGERPTTAVQPVARPAPSAACGGGAAAAGVVGVAIGGSTVEAAVAAPGCT